MPNVLSNPRFLYSCLNALNPYEVMGFFEECGVPLKVERGERVFPVSDRSADIVQALVDKARQLGCRLVHGCADALLIGEERVEGVSLTDGQKLYAHSVIVATGGKSYPATGSTGDGYRLAKQAGHRVTPLRPSLIPLVCKEKYCRDMMGLSLKNVTLKVTDRSSGKVVFEELGEMLFTHFGVSGPLVLSASCHMKPDKTGSLEGYCLFIDLKPGLSHSQLDARILRDFEQFINAKPFSRSLSSAASRLKPKSTKLPASSAPNWWRSSKRCPSPHCLSDRLKKPSSPQAVWMSHRSIPRRWSPSCCPVFTLPARCWTWTATPAASICKLPSPLPLLPETTADFS